MWEIILAGAAAIKIPALIESAARATGEKLLGPVLDHLAQPLKDRASQRTKISQTLAELAARQVTDNPDLYRDTVSNILRQSGARAERVEATFLKTLEVLADRENESECDPGTPSDDWLNRWSRYVEDASSEELQSAFARVLAGEITKNGSFSIGTLRTVAEMSRDVANDFQIIWSEAIVDFAVKYTRYYRGEDWLRLIRLREAGLVSTTDSAIHRPSESDSWGIGNSPRLVISLKSGIPSEISTIDLTRVGVEIGSILPKPNTRKNLQTLARAYHNRTGWLSATLVEYTDSGRQSEITWTGEI